MKSCSANRCNAQASPPFAIKWSDEHLVLRSFESSMWHPGILHTTCQHRRMLHVKNAKFLQSTTSGCQYRRQINPETCPLFCDMDVVFICFFLLNHVLSCFFSHNCKRKTVAETLPPLSRGPQGEVEGRGGRHQGSWVKRAETWVNWAASNPTKLVTEGIVASFNESFKWFNACFLGLKNRGTIPALLGELYRHFLTLLNWYWGLSLFPVIARES